ncbi:hypothetical protein PG994_013507 [Apiospora phragmitis]|uniref:Ankyrin n=1 Tax=Apiospora phragmitis TaxID=2905665 RepID=A0ABR1TB34_9PEZI
MGALHDHTPRERDRLQQMALMEVVGQGDAEASTLFLNIGVDHEVKLLPRISWVDVPRHLYQWGHSLDPLSRAASRCNIRLLGVLLSYNLYEPRHITNTLMAVSHIWDLRRRESYLHISRPDNEEEQTATVAILLNTDVKGIWERLSALNARSCQDFVLHHCQQQINLQADPSAHPCALLSIIFPYDTLRNAIKHGFSLKSIESLLPAGMGIHSEHDEDGNTLLIDALLSASKDRYQLVHFLLQRGADPCVNGLTLTVLEATLWTTKTPRDARKLVTAGPAAGLLDDEEHDKVALTLFRELLELGIPINRSSGHQKRCSRPLLVPLIESGADLFLIQQVVAARAKINEQREEHITTPLISALETDQMEFARWWIEQRADVNASGANIWLKYSILSYACHKGTSLTQLLIENGADVDPPEKSYACSPMEQALANGNVEIVIMLLAHGFKLNQTRGWGELDFAVDQAARHGQLDILNIFVESGGGRGGKASTRELVDLIKHFTMPIGLATPAFLCTWNNIRDGQRPRLSLHWRPNERSSDDGLGP